MTSLHQPTQEKISVDDATSSEEEVDEPNFLTLTGVKHYHIGLPTAGQGIPEQADMLLRLNEACNVIDSACDLEDSDCDDAPEASNVEVSRDQRATSPKKSNILLHCSTESRGALVMCAYLMYGKSLSPKNAYSKLETGAFSNGYHLRNDLLIILVLPSFAIIQCYEIILRPTRALLCMRLCTEPR